MLRNQKRGRTHSGQGKEVDGDKTRQETIAAEVNMNREMHA
jgi:hypothetical protein